MTKASFRFDEKTGALIEVAKDAPKTHECKCGLAGCPKTVTTDDKPEPKISTGQYL